MNLKIALLQLKPHENDQLANTIKADSYCRKAAKEGADIILLPEMWNIGYMPYHDEVNDYDYNPTNPKYPELLEKWKRQSVSRDSDYIKHFCYLAKELNIAIGITYLETYGNNNPRNTISLIDHNGNIVMTYAKVHTCDFSLEYHCTSGDEFKVVDLETSKGRVKIGAMICYDREFPESARVLMLKGAEIILVPNACELEINRLSQIRTRAFENMVGIAVCNYAGNGFGNSVAFDGMAFDKDGSRDMKIIEADKNEGIYMANFNLNSLRDYRKRETWGNAYRKPNTYDEIISTKVEETFIRNNEDVFCNGTTLGNKAKSFKWRYDNNKGLIIYRVFTNGSDNTSIFTNTDLQMIIDHLKKKGELPLANNVEKLRYGNEKDGFGSFIYNNINKDILLVQASSQLVSIFYNAHIIDYNGAKTNMMFYYIDCNWKHMLVRYMKASKN